MEGSLRAFSNKSSVSGENCLTPLTYCGKITTETKVRKEKRKVIDVLRLTDSFIVDTLGLRNSLADAAEKKDDAAISVLADNLTRTARRYATVLELRNNKELFDHWYKLLGSCRSIGKSRHYSSLWQILNKIPEEERLGCAVGLTPNTFFPLATLPPAAALFSKS